MKTYDLLPLGWSLHYIMNERDWREFRERVKRTDPGWQRCSCPNGCKADSCDEQWHYDNASHVKRFQGAKFICRGCHWLKSPPFRISTWQREQQGQLPPQTKAPHIIDCLGWSQEKVDRLRGKDMAEDAHNRQQQGQILGEVLAGDAQTRPWTINLSAMSQYGYSEREISVFEKRMMEDAQAKTDYRAWFERLFNG